MMNYSAVECEFQLDLAEELAQKSLFISELQAKNEALEERVKELERMLFGQSSEKTKYQSDSLFSPSDDDETTVDASDSMTEKSKSDRPKRKPKKKGYREESVAQMERVEHHSSLSQADCACGHCHGTMVKMGERLEREEVEYIPARCICHAYYVTAYKCLNCSGTDKPMIQRAKAPQPLFQKSLASASVVAKYKCLNKYVQKCEYKNVHLMTSQGGGDIG